MVDMSRNVELEIRATDRTGKTFSNLKQNLKKLTEEFKEQEKAAERGVADMKRYEDALKELGKAADGFADLRKALSVFEKTSSTIDDMNGAMRRLRENQTKLNEDISRTGVATRNQMKDMRRNADAIEALSSKIDGVQQNWAKQRLELELLGVETKDLAKANETLVASQNEALQAIIKQREAQAKLNEANAQAKSQYEAQRAEYDKTHARVRQRIKDLQDEKKAILEARKIAAKNQYERREKYISAQNSATASQATKRAETQAYISQAEDISKTRKSLRGLIEDERKYAQAKDKSSRSVEEALSSQKEQAKTLDEVRRQIVRSRAVYRDTAASMDDLHKASEELNASQKKLVSISNLVDDFRKARNASRELVAEYRELAAKQRELSNVINTGRGGRSQIVELERTVSAMNKIGAEYARQRTLMRQHAAELNNAGINTNKLSDAQHKLVASAKTSAIAMKSLNAAMEGVAHSSEKSTRSILRSVNSSRTSLDFFQRLRGQVLALTSAYVGLYGAVDLFNQVIQSGKDEYRLKVTAELLSANDWAKDIEGGVENYFRNTAERMGLVLRDAVRDGTKFFIAAKEAGRDAQQTMYVWEQFTGLGGLLGMNNEEMGRMTKALEQMFSKGTVSAEELKQQLGDVLPNATALFSRAIGVTTAELMDLMKQGKVSADVLPLVAAEIEKTYGKDIAASFDNLQKAQNRLNNAWQDWLRIINDTGVSENFKQLIIELTEFFRSEEGAAWAQRIGSAINAVIDALRVAVKNIDMVIAALSFVGAAVIAQSFLSIARAFHLLFANISSIGKPLGGLATQFGKLTGVLSKSATSAGGFSAALGVVLKSLSKLALPITIIMGLAEAIREVFLPTVELKDVMNGLYDSIWLVGQIVEVVGDVIQSVFTGAVRAVKNVFSGLFSLAKLGFNKLAGDSDKAASKTEKSWQDTFATMEGGLSGFIQVAARLLDSFVAGFKVGMIEIGGYIDVTARKLKGLFTGESASYDEIDSKKIYQDVLDEQAVKGYEQAYKKIVTARRQADKELSKPLKDSTSRPDLSKLNGGKKAEDAQKEAEKVEKLREKAERARERAEAAALKRLNKMLDVQKALEHYIKAMNSKELMGSWEDNFTKTLNAEKARFAPREEPSASAKTDVTDTVKSNGEVALQAAEKSAKASEIATKRTGKHIAGVLKGTAKSIYKYAGYCAAAVKEALSAVGFKYIKGDGYRVAQDLINSKQGFQQVEYDENYVPQKGDVMSLPKGFGQSSKYGHVAIYNGKEWVSDAVQRIHGNTAATNDVSWNNIKSGKSKPTIARHTGVNGGVIRGSMVSSGADYYKEEKSYYDNLKRESQIANQYNDLLESRDEIVKKITEMANEKITEMFKTDGVTIDALVSAKSIEATLDGSLNMGELSAQFAKIIEPQYKKQADETAALLYSQLSKEHGEQTAKTMVSAFQPKIQELYSRKASKEFEEIIDSRFKAIIEKADKSSESRDEYAQLVQAQTMAGSITPAEAMQQMLEYDEKRTAEIRKQIEMLETFLASDAMGKISDAALTKYRSQIATMRKGITNPAETSDPTDSNEQVNKFAEAYAARIEQLIAAKGNIEDKYNNIVAAGLMSQSEASEKMKLELSEVNTELGKMAEQGSAAYATMSSLLDPAKAAQFAESIRNARVESQLMGFETRLLKETGAQLLTGFTTGFDAVAQALAGIATGQRSTAEGMTDLKNAFLSWAAQFLMKIAQMILQAAIFRALTSAMGSGGGGGFGGILGGALGALGGGIFHTGGVVGGGKNYTRKVNPLLFANAPRYHTGGIVGLAPNEVPLIAQKGEEVLTSQDPRHRDNGGLNLNGGSQPLTVINTFDPVDAVRRAFASKEGQKLLIEAASKNKKAFRSM